MQGLAPVQAQTVTSHRYSTQDMRHVVSGRAVTVGDGMLHIEGVPGTTLCGKPVTSYPLHWDLVTVIACGDCLTAAGVPRTRRDSD